MSNITVDVEVIELDIVSTPTLIVELTNGVPSAQLPTDGLEGQILERHTSNPRTVRWTSIEDLTAWFESQLLL